MSGLNFGQRNVLHSTLREMGIQIEALLSLLDGPKSGSPSLIPLVDSLSEEETRRAHRVLVTVHESIREMCSAFEIELEPLRVRGRLHTDKVYITVGLEGMRPGHLAAYGRLAPEDEVLLTFHVQRILAELKEL